MPQIISTRPQARRMFAMKFLEALAMRLHGVEIPVLDIDRAYEFYANVLDFPIVGRFSADSALFFVSDVHGGMAMLVRYERAPGHGPRLMFTAEGGIEVARARLEARGVKFLGATNHGPMASTAHFLDSEGNQLTLFEHKATPGFRERARGSNAEQIERLAELEARLEQTLAGMTAAQAAYRPAPGEWAAVGHLAHLVDTLDNCGVVAHELAGGRQPPRDRLLEREYEVESLQSGLSELRRAFSDARRWIAKLPAESATTETLPHGVFGPLNDREWVAFMMFHVGMHIAQIAEIQASSGYPVSGVTMSSGTGPAPQCRAATP